MHNSNSSGVVELKFTLKRFGIDCRVYLLYKTEKTSWTCSSSSILNSTFPRQNRHCRHSTNSHVAADRTDAASENMACSFILHSIPRYSGEEGPKGEIGHKFQALSGPK